MTRGRLIRRVVVVALGALAAAATALGLATRAALAPLPGSLDAVVLADAAVQGARLVDRRGEPLNLSFSGWNVHDRAELHAIPAFLREAFVTAEDKRFYEHGGPDWRARAAALVTNVVNLRAVRGASTITEQVVRMIHPRPRTVWSRWVEGFDAARLERRFTKDEILEFYLNQVPYASERRGVAQAARHYFNRDLYTLSRKEMLALAVLVRSPSRFDLRRNADASEGAIVRLAAALVAHGTLTSAESAAMLAAPFALESPRLTVAAPHFVRHVRGEIAARPSLSGVARVTTTLDGRLQGKVQRLLDQRLRRLATREAAHGAVLVADHTTGEVLAWVVGGGGAEEPATYIDTVLTPRQPGSALKPFLYALALDGDWTAAHVIDDAPLAASTSGGLHNYQNYSRRFYGPVTVRDALGNSLNIPALKTLHHVGAERYLATLDALGFGGLTRHPDFYGDGIALGSGPVTLYELVQAYAALANGGVARPLTVLADDPSPRPSRRVFSAEAASLVGNILSDADARALEFGRDSVLAFPVQTAVKTGTSSDFRDAWIVGFDHRYVAGVWIGNLDQRPSEGLTGSTGPALVLRSVFAELARSAPTRPLYLSRKLERVRICVPVPLAAASAGCVEREEWFRPGTAPSSALARGGAGEVLAGERADDTATAAPSPSTPSQRASSSPRLRLRQPTPGLSLAFDPRLPAEAQAFQFELEGLAPGDRVYWQVDGREHVTDDGHLLWPVTRGAHEVSVSVRRDGVEVAALDSVSFAVR